METEPAKIRPTLLALQCSAPFELRPWTEATRRLGGHQVDQVDLVVVEDRIGVRAMVLPAPLIGELAERGFQ